MGMHHKSVPGKRVHVILKDGRKIVGRFIETTDRRLRISRRGRREWIPWADIRAFSNFKPAARG